MKTNPNSTFWLNNAYADVMIILKSYEDRLVDEVIECQLHINAYDPTIAKGENLNYWVGSKDRIFMEVYYLHYSHGITFDKVMALVDSLPKYEDMSPRCQRIWDKLNG